MKLIKELNEFESQTIIESAEDGKKSYFIEGIFMQAEKQNKNGRIYKKGILESELNRYGKLIEEKRALGELGHPDSPAINLHNVSHLITALKFEGNDIVGRAKIMDTPYGKIAKNFIDEGVKLGVSSRGMGSLKSENGINVVQPDFHLATVDIVADPSAHDAFVRGIMEDKEWMLVNGVWTEEHQEIAKVQIKKASRREIEEVSLRIFETFIKRL